MTAMWIGATLALPFVLAIVWLVRSRTPLAALWIPPLPALGLAVFGHRSESFGPFVFDAPAAMLLGAAAILWMLAGLYARSACKAEVGGRVFGPCWLLAMAGSFGVFVATDMVGFLIFYAMVSLPAYGLVVATKTLEAKRAGGLYLAFALVGENVLLIAFVLLAIHPGDPGIALPFVVAGFGLKLALWPFHFWMPAAHAAASVPASAVLSGIVVKAGIIGLLRFVPFDVARPLAGEILAAFGFFTAVFGVVVGLRQSALKMILGYSSVSQMGFLAAVIGMGLAGGDAAVIALAALYAANHMLVKGALFLSVGCRGAGALAWLPATLLGLGLAGLPLTGGALAKLAVKDPLGGGAALVLANLSAAGTAMLMLHFATRLRAAARAGDAPTAKGFAAFALASVAALVVPWLLLPLAGLGVDAVMYAPLATLGPIVGGAMVFAVCRRWFGGMAAGGDADRAREGRGEPFTGWIACVETNLRAWPVASLALLALVLLLAAALLIT